MVPPEDHRTSAGERIRAHLTAGITAAQACLADEAVIEAAQRGVEILRHAVQHGGKIVLSGNGGSAADATSGRSENVLEEDLTA